MPQQHLVNKPMLIIHGTYRFAKQKLESREDVCNSCEKLRQVDCWSSFNVFHLFWIPLIPLGRHSRWLCTVCHQNPHARYKTSRPMKIAGLVALAFFLFAFFTMEPKPDEVGFMWGARIVLSLAFVALLWSILKRPPKPSEYSTIAARIKEQLGDLLRPASTADLKALQKLRCPESILDFYRHFAPAQTIENQQIIRLHTVAEIVENNSSSMPTCYTTPHGYVGFATNFTGDAYCFDLNHPDPSHSPRVVLISHEVISEETTPDDMARLAKPVAVNLKEFLALYLSGKVDEECLSWDDLD